MVVVGPVTSGAVAATLLARAGLSVVVLEEKDTVGGAAKTEAPLPEGARAAPHRAYLLGLMPPELMRTLGLELPLQRRDQPFLPTTGERYLLFGSDRVAMRAQFTTFFSEADWRANARLEERSDSSARTLRRPGSRSH